MDEFIYSPKENLFITIIDHVVLDIKFCLNTEPVGVLQVGDLLPQPSRFLLVVLQVWNLGSFSNIS
jgi:hypothetical protein